MQNAMRPRASARLPEVKLKSVQDLPDEDIFAMPKSESDSKSSSDEEGLSNAADIKSTQFIRRKSEEPKPLSQKGKGKSTQVTKSTYTTVSGNGTRSTKAAKQLAARPSGLDSTRSLGPSKRKTKENGVNWGAGRADPFGQIPVKKPKTGRTYASTGQMNNRRRTQTMLSQDSLQTKQSIVPAGRDRDSSPRSDTRSPQMRTFKNMHSSQSDSPEKPLPSSPLGASFKKVDTSESDSPVRSNSDSNMRTKLRNMDESGIDSPVEASGGDLLEFKRAEGLDSDFLVTESGFPPVSAALPNLSPKLLKPRLAVTPVTQLPAFKTYSVDGDLAERAQSILGQDRDIIGPISTQFDEEFDSMSQIARCPMCRKPVNAEDLRKRGEMNTRQQEKFCRDHQRKDAKEDWSLKGYPEIDWNILDARISQHHAFIKTLVNGAASHYRTILDETVKAGKDRTLLKSESNLTPGYYGSRGLRAISENIMHEFTPLLKRKVVKDRLMAARGVTGFVQSVLVPEVTVLLIMEDMNVMIDEARRVLKDSVGMGELVNEEIRDVVSRRVEDSEVEDDEDYD